MFGLLLTGDDGQWYALETLGECFIILRSRGSCFSCGHDLKQDGLLMLEIPSTDWSGVPMSSKFEPQENSQWEQCKKNNENSFSNSRNQL